MGSEMCIRDRDKTVVRLEPHEEQGMMQVSLGAEFYPPAEPPAPEPSVMEEVEEDEPQPYVEGQPTIFEPNPPPAKPKKAPARKRVTRTSKPQGGGGGGTTRRPPRRKKPE